MMVRHRYLIWNPFVDTMLDASDIVDDFEVRVNNFGSHFFRSRDRSGVIEKQVEVGATLTMETTHTLGLLFGAAVERRGGAKSVKSEPSATPDPFEEGFASVSGVVCVAIVEAGRYISAALKAMTLLSPTMDIEGGLMVIDAELASASASVKAFHSLMEKARLEVDGRNTGRNALASHHLELITHYATAASTLGGVVDKRRLDLTICREQLEQHRRELSCPTSLWTIIEGAEGRSPERSRGRDPTSRIAGGKDEVLHHHLRNAAATAATTAATSRRVIEGATDHLANTVLTFARKTTAVTRKVATSGVGGGVEELLSGGGAKGANETPGRNSAPGFVYTEEEQAHLEQQREQMLLEERVSNTGSARDIEATISELSHLTSMMQTHVLEQEEQLEGLERNTTEATTNITKATEELRKPLKESWSATMQMTFLLWISTAMIMGAHFIIG